MGKLFGVEFTEGGDVRLVRARSREDAARKYAKTWKWPGPMRILVWEETVCIEPEDDDGAELDITVFELAAG